MFCSRNCGYLWRAAQAQAAYPERFWSRVDKNGPIPKVCPELGPCWIWIGTRGPQGYGLFGFKSPAGKVMTQAYRASWVLTNGEIPEGMGVLHRCDNPPCVNPGHLFLGTRTTNMRDAVNKGRIARGEGNAAAILTSEDVLAIRISVAAGVICKTVANKYGVTMGNVWGISRGLTWKHVGGPIVRTWPRGIWQNKALTLVEPEPDSVAANLVKVGDC